MNRRVFLKSATVALGLTATTAGIGTTSSSHVRRRVRAVAFDGFPIIDPRPIAAKAEELFPGKADALIASWRARQFEYSWLRTLSGQYVDFWHTTEDALVFAAESVSVALDGHSRQRLMETYLELKAWPDVR